MKNRILFLSFVILVFCSCSDNKSNKDESYSKIPNSILIVYSSGKPYKTLSDISPEEIDAHSGATPSDMNVAMISGTLVDKLRDKNYTVRLARASEITDYRELLQYDLLMLGTSTYFWNMNWEMKKMMDECFEKIYVLRRDDFKKMKHIAFAMAEYGPCGENAIKQINFGITDCSAQLDASKVFIAKQTRPEYEQQINQLANKADSIMMAR